MKFEATALKWLLCISTSVSCLLTTYYGTNSIDTITRNASTRLSFLRRFLKLAPPNLKLLSKTTLIPRLARPVLAQACGLGGGAFHVLLT